ncbi:DUF3309 family protein [Tabrizicola sp.]|uniref:DUF3309 family protein n=1 Tax=Tabrizicola sp. TaxID=2005166 RepID=UPI00286D3986|nr:DUF3309 family protein [Tabrizicola sp.]
MKPVLRSVEINTGFQFSWHSPQLHYVPRKGAIRISLGTILIIILVIYLLGGFSGGFGGYGYGLGHAGIGIGGVLLIIVVALLLTGRI